MRRLPAREWQLGTGEDVECFSKELNRVVFISHDRRTHFVVFGHTHGIQDDIRLREEVRCRSGLWVLTGKLL